MRIMRAFVALAVGIVVAYPGVRAQAGSSDQLVFRTAGFYKGQSSITQDQITCEIPTTSSAIGDGAFAMGMWNTYGARTIFFPDPNNGLANPCGVWLQMRNNLRGQSIVVDHLNVTFSIPGAARFRNFGVATRNNFPSACRSYRKSTLYATALIPPLDAGDNTTSNAGTTNAAFVQLLPLVGPDLINCLRGQYAALSTNVFVSLPLLAKVTAIGFSDAGDTYTSNPVRYTLNLRHTCGNGRRDDGEQCDPNSPVDACSGVCQSNICSNDPNRGCSTNADCQGFCVTQGQPTECLCNF